MDFSKYSKQEAIEALEEIFNSPYIETYTTIKGKIDEINAAFKNVRIDVTSEDDKSFDNFLKYTKQAADMYLVLDDLLSKMSADHKALLKSQRTTAKDGTLESLMRKHKDGKQEN